MDSASFDEYLRRLDVEFGTGDNFDDIVYLDHAGATRASAKQLQEVFHELSSPPFCMPANPHSTSSLLATPMERRIHETRRVILNHFCASGDDYTVIFTSGATAAIKLVCDIFPWGLGGALCYTENSHTSLLALREFSDRAFLVETKRLIQANLDLSKYCRDCPSSGGVVNSAPNVSDRLNLFAYPGECNFSGSKLSLERIGMIVQGLNCAQHSLGGGNSLLEMIGALEVFAPMTGNGSTSSALSPAPEGRWLSFLDASKLASTSKIDLSALSTVHRPDFMCVSFYKMFGYPTGQI
jgi:molybdenum cofactor sulfurtransferase